MEKSDDKESTWPLAREKFWCCFVSGFNRLPRWLAV
jgi:hypothetical protein